MKPKIWTLGTSNRNFDEFVSLLKECGIELVIDVRRFPHSRRFPWFNRHNLEAQLLQVGIAYCWLGDLLGGYRTEGYERFSLSPTFAEGIQRLKQIALGRRCCLICAEKWPWKCHRLTISRTLEQNGWDVIHIIDRGYLCDQRSLL